MNNPSNPDAPSSASTQNEIIFTRLQQTPNEWVEMTELARLAGCFAVNSRMADIRRVRQVTIENRQETKGRKRHSFYKLVA